MIYKSNKSNLILFKIAAWKSSNDFDEREIFYIYRPREVKSTNLLLRLDEEKVCYDLCDFVEEFDTRSALSFCVVKVFCNGEILWAKKDDLESI